MDEATIHQKFVDFCKWCYSCKHAELPENQDPCWECLTQPVNEGSTKPVNFTFPD